jgi:hypothetical protein
MLRWLVPSLAAALFLARTPHLEAEETAAACVEQAPQAFLLRSAWRSPSDAAHARSVRYRTERYGYFAPFGQRSWNALTPSEQAVRTTFLGVAVTLHRRVVPALRCAEAALAALPESDRYQPTRLEGLRTANSFHGGEVSNHVYGIALDVDPHRNPCCGCGARYRDHAACRRTVTTPFERAAFSRAWIETFERFGFAWLGRDPQLMDTMHFEFLGEPPPM